MSEIPYRDANQATRHIDTFERTEAGKTVSTQAVAIVDPQNGNPARPDSSGRIPIAADQLPLPAGAATASKQDEITAALAQLISALAGTLAVNVGNFPSTQSVSASSLPLPSGAATATKQDTGNASLAQIVTALAGALSVNVGNFPTTQVISAASLPLPSGAATESKQDALLAEVSEALGEVAGLLHALRFLSMSVDPGTGRSRVSIENINGNLTLTTLNNISNFGGRDAAGIWMSQQNAEARMVLSQVSITS